jgi:hypothetical protein
MDAGLTRVVWFFEAAVGPGRDGGLVISAPDGLSGSHQGIHHGVENHSKIVFAPAREGFSHPGCIILHNPHEHIP